VRGAEIIERLERDAVGVPLVPGDGAGPKPRAAGGASARCSASDETTDAKASLLRRGGSRPL
jgi:hypothetical protein